LTGRAADVDRWACKPDRPVAFWLGGRRFDARLRAAIREITAGELLVTNDPQAAQVALLAGRPVIAVGGDELRSAASAGPTGADMTVVGSLEEARDVLLERLGPRALTVETLRHVPAPPGPPRSRPSLVSVVIPARNVAAEIGDQLEALAGQDYDGRYEIVVADNGSTDRTREQALEQAARLGLDLRVVDASGTPGVSHARNAGCAAARGELIAICDADDVAAQGWLSSLVEVALRFDFVGGAVDASQVNADDVQAWRELPPASELPTRYRFLPYAHGCNAAVWREVWERSGGWDEAIRDGCDDIEFAWRLQLGGHRLGVAPAAVVHYRLRDTLAGQARQSYGYHRNGGLLIKRFGVHGARPSSPRAAALDVLYALRPLPAALRSTTARAQVLRGMAGLWGRIRSSIEYRTWAL
jgi:GT2 family glycosyltransferase